MAEPMDAFAVQVTIMKMVVVGSGDGVVDGVVDGCYYSKGGV